MPEDQKFSGVDLPLVIRLSRRFAATASALSEQPDPNGRGGWSIRARWDAALAARLCRFRQCCIRGAGLTGAVFLGSCVR